MMKQEKSIKGKDILKQITAGRINNVAELEKAVIQDIEKLAIVVLTHGERVTIHSQHPSLLKKEMNLTEWEVEKPQLEKRFCIFQVNIIGAKVPVAEREQDVLLD